MARWTAVMVLAGVMACCFFVSGVQAYCYPGQNENCKDEGERCLSGRVSECIRGLVCPTRIGQSSWCQDPRKLWPQCKSPPEHCKPNGAPCTPGHTSECKEGNHCDIETGTCQSGQAPKKKGTRG